MKTLVLMRHGETLLNQKHRIQGVCDAPLTRLGQAQARQAARFINELNLEFDYLCSSPSERACDTLEIVRPGLSYDRYPGLREINFGSFEGEPEVINPPIALYTDFFEAAGGESRADAGKRMDAQLKEILSDPERTCVLATSHGGALKNFARLHPTAEHIDLSRPFRNCCVLVYDYDEDSQTFYMRDLYNKLYTQADLDADLAAGTALQPEDSVPAEKPSEQTAQKPAGRKRLVLMRHGQTLFNAKKMVQGWCDSPLTERGKKQARDMKETALPYIEAADHVYTSTSERASQTLEQISDVPYTRLKGLKECCYGIFEGENMLIGIKPEHFEMNEVKNPFEPR